MKKVAPGKKTPVINIEIAGNELNETKPTNTGLCRNIRLYFREFCLNSSLHGIRYLGEKDRTKIERVLWFLFFIASLFMCSQLIKKTWQKWDSMPVIIDFAEKPTFVWQVPFPAVTICPETRIRQTVYNFTEAYFLTNLFDKEEEKLFSDLSLTCNILLYTQGPEITDQSAIDSMNDVVPELSELIWSYTYLNVFQYEDLFSISLTEHGLCYTFNSLNHSEIFNEDVHYAFYPNMNKTTNWSLDKGYKKSLNRDEEKNVYPKRAFSSGKKAGLEILLKDNEQDFDYMCTGPTQGFKIILHSPEEVPRVDQHYTMKVSWKQNVVIAVQPDIMTASQELKDYEPSRRNCFFSEEKKLRYFKIYTQPNCEIECLTNYTLSKCGCVAFYMPRNESTPICGSARSFCVMAAKDEFLLKELSDEDLEESYLHLKIANITSPKCNCLPGCKSLAYNADTISTTNFDYEKIFQAFSVNETEFSGIQLSRINIFFKDTQFRTWRRSEIYDQTDFLASCGGLLGIFMGFSLLSFIEIIYFVTLRFCCNITMQGVHMWNAFKTMYE